MHNYVEVVFTILSGKLIMALCQVEKKVKEIRYKVIRYHKMKMVKERKCCSPGNNTNLSSKNVGYSLSQKLNITVGRCFLGNFWILLLLFPL